jgi:hypothetical protein
MRLSTLILGSALLSQGALAAEPLPTTLEKLFDHINELPNAKGVPVILDRIKHQHPEELKALCNQIMAENFYEKAQIAKVGTLKSRAMVTYCSGTVFERADLKQATQKDKPAEAKKEAIKLKPVDFSKKSKGVEDEQKNLKAIEEEMLANAELLGKKQEFEQKLQKVTEQLKQAQEHYDNLAIAIMGMREDLKAFSFKVFKPHDHDQASPEGYLEALESALPKESAHLLDSHSKQQLTMASNLLKEANKNHELAREELEILNREMMQMNK